MKVDYRLISIGFSLVILVNSVWATLNFSYYVLDPVGFIERLCENKDQPELQCQGKCHLKKVAESQDQRQRSPETTINFKDVLVFIPPTLVLDKTDNLVINHHNMYRYHNLYSFYMVANCFRPPQV